MWMIASRSSLVSVDKEDTLQFQTNRNPSECELTAPTERLVRSIIGLLINVCGLLPAGAQTSLWEQHYQEGGNCLYLHSVHDKGEEEAYKHTNTLRTSPAAAHTQRASTTQRSFTTALTQSFTHLTALQVGC